MKQFQLMQRRILCNALLSIALACGCSTRLGTLAPTMHYGESRPSTVTTTSTNLVDSAILFVGRIVKVNNTAGFALISFPIGCLPQPGQLLYVFRNGQRIGELKTTQYMLDELVVADIVCGSCQPGDEVADR